MGLGNFQFLSCESAVLIARLNNFKGSLHCEKVNERLDSRDKAFFERIRAFNFFRPSNVSRIGTKECYLQSSVFCIAFCRLSKLLT